MRKSIVSIIAASVLTLTVAAAAVACGGPGKGLKSLDLTDDQREQVSALMKQTKTEKKSFKEKRKALKKQHRELTDNYSESLAMEVATQAGELEKLQSLARINHHQAMLEILTDEQEVKFKELMKKRDKRQGKHKGKKKGEDKDRDHDDD